MTAATPVLLMLGKSEHRAWTVKDVAALTLGAILITVLSAVLVPALVDDSFIYLRVAENIGAGRGWYYNADEINNPATSTTFTLLLAAVGRIVGYSDTALAVSYGLSLYVLFAVQYAAWRSEGRVFAILIVGGIVLERVDIQDSHGLATLIQAPFGRRLG
jgi:hypothetical protein